MIQRYSHKKLPDEPIVIMKFGADFDIATDAKASTAAGLAVLNTLSAPIFYIVDLNGLVNMNVEMLIQGAALAAMDSDSVYRHPIIQEILFVAGEKRSIFQLVAEGLNTEIYGYIRARAFATMEEAMAYARDNA